MAFLSVLVAFACGQQVESPLRDFYYPVDRARTYRYVLNDSLQIQDFQLTPVSKGRWIIEIFDEHGVKQQQLVESAHTTGITLDSLRLMRGAGVSVDISSDFIFPFMELDSTQVAVSSRSWQEVGEDGQIITNTVIRNRRFIGYTEVQYDGDHHEGVVFKYDDLVISEQDGQQEFRSSGREYYAKGIGLIRRDRLIGGQYPLVERLVDIQEGHVW